MAARAGTTNRLAIRRPNITEEVSVAFLPDFWSLRGITDANSPANRHG